MAHSVVRSNNPHSDRRWSAVKEGNSWKVKHESSWKGDWSEEHPSNAQWHSNQADAEADVDKQVAEWDAARG